MQYAIVKPIEYGLAKLEMPDFLKKIWPFELQLDKWPSFCGAGQGFGDAIVIESVCGVRTSCVCFIHDIEWAVCAKTFAAFMKSNLRFYLNLRNLVHANSDSNKAYIETRCFMRFIGVSTVGWKCFISDQEEWNGNPTENVTVKKRLHRLAMATKDEPQFHTGRNQC